MITLITYHLLLNRIYGDLIGAVVNVFTWYRGEWMGFSLAVHLYPVLKSWLIALKQEEGVSIKKEISDQYAFVEGEYVFCRHFFPSKYKKCLFRYRFIRHCAYIRIRNLGLWYCTG